MFFRWEHISGHSCGKRHRDSCDIGRKCKKKKQTTTFWITLQLWMSHNPQMESLKRNISEASLQNLCPSPRKRLASVHNQGDLSQPCTVRLASGDFLWRNKGVEGEELDKGLKLYHTSNQLKGLTTDPEEITKPYLEELRQSQHFCRQWKVAELQ